MKKVVVVEEHLLAKVEYIIDVRGDLPIPFDTAASINKNNILKRQVIEISPLRGNLVKIISIENCKTYRIPVVWTMRGIVEVQAKDLASAIEIAHDSELPKGSYLDDSFSIDSEDIEEVEAS